MENILLFISSKYIDCIKSIKDLMKSGNNNLTILICSIRFNKLITFFFNRSYQPI